MVSFDEMIKGLHDGKGSLADDGLLVDPKGVITINDKRQFTLPANFNPVIGYEGDVNSQIITFDLPTIVESHDLTECTNKIIKWSNLQNGLEGRSKLEPVGEVIGDRQYLQWKVEPDVFVKAGTIQIAISFYDTVDEKIAFQWNTASFSGLSVVANASDIGFFEPAENEVLFISEETRRIVAPQGYNNVVCNYGEVGVSKIYFRAKRKIRGIDLLDSNTTVKIRCNLNGDIYVYNTPSENLKVVSYSTEIADVDGLVNIVWYVPAEITDNEQNYAGTFSIEVDFETEGQKQVWRTSTYNGLIIGSDVFQIAENYMKNPDRYYVLDGNLYKDNVAYTVIGGTYLVKKFYEGRDIPLQGREIVAEYDEDEVYKGLKIGVETEIDGESKVELQSIMPEAATKKELNSLEEELSNSITAESAEWTIKDGKDNTIFKVDATGAYTTSLTLNGESVVSMIDGKAPKNHASTDTTYGVANAENYGHVKASSTTPKENGEKAVVGNETGTFARGDHIHPLPNRFLAEKTIELSGDVTGTATSTGENGWSITTTVNNYIPTLQKGANNGVATLNENGKIPTSQLPSYVDDVIEGYYTDPNFYADSENTTKISAETGKIYLDLSTNKTYRWGGTTYVEISASLALGEIEGTAYYGNLGKIAYEHATTSNKNPHGLTYQGLGLTTEEWVLTLEDNTTATKNIVLLGGN